MKGFHSVKLKITCWYTGIVIVMFAVTLGIVFLISEYYGEDSVKAELLDEVKDLRDDIIRYPDYFPREELIVYYDDGVMLSVYDEAGNFINGVLPDGFPEDIPFKEEKITKAADGEDNWFLNDEKIQMPDGSYIWVRGIISFSSVILMIQRLIKLMGILCPVLIAFTAFVGYRMIQHSLRPLQDIIYTADEISASGELSTRLSMPGVRDEFYDLSATFNHMFDSLERTFIQEKQFSSNAAHELRTPIFIMLSHCEYCLEELELTEEAREELEIIRKKALDMSELVSQLLTLTRAENKTFQPDFEEVDLLMLAKSVIEELEEKAAKRDIRIELENHLENPVIQADMSMLTRLFINLIENAVFYGRQNGYVKVCMAERGHKIYLQFEDNGIGIPKEALDRIWERFYQVDASRSASKGFGLGLPMVKHIAECHGGTVQVSSVFAKGSVFTVTIPRERS